MNKNLKFAAIAVVWLFIIYWIENWLTSKFGFLSTSNIIGFVIIALITAFSLFYVVKKANASPNI